MSYKDKEKQETYEKQWYQKNKDTILAKAKEYRTEHKDKVKEGNKEYRMIHKEKIATYKKQYCELHKEEIKEYRNAHKDERREYSRQYAKEHLEQINIKVQKRNARVRNLEYSFSLQDWNDCKDYFNLECAYCGKQLKNLSQDHVVPVTKGGTYTKNNIVPACRSCNSSKNSHDLEEWYRKQEFFSEERLNKINICIGGQ